MKEYELVRSYLPDRTIGHLMGLRTLERPWLQNQRNVSCIPEGRYTVKRDNFGRYQYYRVEDVPDRSGIEFHGGAVPAHSKGCILVGTGFTRQYDLTGSKDALEQLLNTTHECDFILVIRAFDPVRDYELISA